MPYHILGKGPGGLPWSKKICLPSCLVGGYCVPVVLCPGSEHRWLFIGESYVYGAAPCMASCGPLTRPRACVMNEEKLNTSATRVDLGKN